MSEHYDLHPPFVTIPHPRGPEKFATLAIPVEHPFVRKHGSVYFMEAVGRGVTLALDEGLSGEGLQIAAAVFADWYEKRSDEAHFMSHAVNYLTYSKQWKELTARTSETTLLCWEEKTAAIFGELTDEMLRSGIAKANSSDTQVPLESNAEEKGEK